MPKRHEEQVKSEFGKNELNSTSGLLQGELPESMDAYLISLPMPKASLGCDRWP